MCQLNGTALSVKELATDSQGRTTGARVLTVSSGSAAKAIAPLEPISRRLQDCLARSKATREKEDVALAEAKAQHRAVKQTLANIDKTLADCQKTSSGVADVFSRWEDIKRQFDAVIQRSVGQIAAALAHDQGMASHLGGMINNSQSTKHVRPKGLPSLDLDGVAAFIKSDNCKNIVFLTGAGISVAAGIPDYRSSGGMYNTLQPDKLTATEEQRARMKRQPNYSMSSALFKENPNPYLEVKRPFILGTAEREWKPTLFHWLQRLCASKGKLMRVYTQNIDSLDSRTGLDEAQILPVHGSMHTVSCAACSHAIPLRDFAAKVRVSVKDVTGADPDAPAESLPCDARAHASVCGACGAWGVRNDIVLFGEDLPARFASCREADMPEADLLVVAGTSLTVAPANSLVQLARSDCARVLINRELVGEELGFHAPRTEDTEHAKEAGAKKKGEGSAKAGLEGRDVFLQGDTDYVAMSLIKKLGWESLLRAEIKQFHESQKHNPHEPQASAESSRGFGSGSAKSSNRNNSNKVPMCSIDNDSVLCHAMAPSSAALLRGSTCVQLPRT